MPRTVTGSPRGPGQGGVPEIFLTNVLIFGKDAFRVDIIGHWLGGHEPGNFGLFHIGKERGVSTALNPHNIPIYRWEDAGPKLIALDQAGAHAACDSLPAKRRRSALYHLCNEPYAYPSEPQAACLEGGESPGMRVLGQTQSGNRRANRSRWNSTCRDGHGRATGDVQCVWRTGGRAGRRPNPPRRACGGLEPQQRPSGLYTCRLWAEGASRTASIIFASRA